MPRVPPKCWIWCPLIPVCWEGEALIFEGGAYEMMKVKGGPKVEALIQQG